MLFYIGEERCTELDQLGLVPDLIDDHIYLYNYTESSDERITVDFNQNGFNVTFWNNWWPRYFLRGQDSPLRIQSWGDLPNLFSMVCVVDGKISSHASNRSFLERPRNLGLEQAALNIAGEIGVHLANSLRHRRRAPKLYTTGGLDTAVIEAVIKANQFDVDIDRSLHGTRCDPRWSTRGAQRRFLLPYHPDLKQIPPHDGCLITGHWGGVAMGRWPDIVRTYAHLDGWDYDRELESHRGNYLYNFLNSPTHRAADLAIHPGKKVNTGQEALDHATTVLYHSHEVRNFDKTELITPFRSAEIHQIVHCLKPEIFKNNALTSSLHMAVIEVCDPSVFDTLDHIKFKSPFG